jgi:plastocyanin
MQSRFVIAAVVTGFGLAACGTGTTHHTAAATAASTMPDMPMAAAPLTGQAVATSKVTINNFAFMPAIITVKAGTTVTWTNMDEEPHTVTDGADGIKSQVLGNQGSTFSYTFTKTGTFSYNCSIHPFMHGMVEVTA